MDYGNGTLPIPLLVSFLHRRGKAHSIRYRKADNKANRKSDLTPVLYFYSASYQKSRMEYCSRGAIHFLTKLNWSKYLFLFDVLKDSLP